MRDADSRPILVAESVRKVYRSGADSVVALHGLDLVVPQGEFVAVMGPSGSGKTTLLNCVSGLDEIDDRVGEHLGMDPEFALVVEGEGRGCRDRADPELDGGTVRHEVGDEFADSALHVAELWDVHA